MHRLIQELNTNEYEKIKLFLLIVFIIEHQQSLRCRPNFIAMTSLKASLTYCLLGQSGIEGSYNTYFKIMPLNS